MYQLVHMLMSLRKHSIGKLNESFLKKKTTQTEVEPSYNFDNLHSEWELNRLEEDKQK